MSVEFAWPWLFAALPLPLLSWWLLPRAAQAPTVALRVPFLALLAQSGVLRAGARPAAWRRWLAIVGWVLLVVAAARPQLLGETIQLPVTGRSLMLAIDLSGSMANDDMLIAGRQVSRATAVKLLASDFVQRRVGDRLGLILFGRAAYLQAPLTLDRRTVSTLLGEAQVGLAGKETAIGDAIGLAVPSAIFDDIVQSFLADDPYSIFEHLSSSYPRNVTFMGSACQKYMGICF